MAEKLRLQEHRDASGTAWEFVHPRCARKRRDDMEEVEAMVAAGEAETWQSRLTALAGALVAAAITLGARPEGQVAAMLSVLVGVGLLVTNTRRARIWQWWKAVGGRTKIAVLGGVVMVSVVLLSKISCTRASPSDCTDAPALLVIQAR